VGDERGWTAEDPRRQFIDVLWKAVTDFVNAPHHPEGTNRRCGWTTRTLGWHGY
jgi:hypothetical protein